jgi:hypothetical protein
MRAAPKEQPKTTDAIANELLIGGRLSSSAFRMDARWNPTTADAGAALDHGYLSLI